MVDQKDILALSYLKLEPFTGSDRDLRYRIERINEDNTDLLLTTAWKGVFSFDNTPDEEKITYKSDFSEDGIEKLVGWLNERGNE